MRCFELHRIEDVSGISGTGVVAQGVEFDDGCVALRWLTEWPTSVVFHDRAGFDVVGVDIAPQPNYPYEFHRADAMTFPLDGYDAIHASPPCQGYSTQTADRSRHQRLIEPVRDRLCEAFVPYVIENVEGATRHLIDPVRLCGSSFGLDLRRHRYFESNVALLAPPCDHSWQTPRFRSLDMKRVRAGSLASVVGVHGHINYAGEFELRKAAMGIDWMTNAELVEAVPPAYTEHIGRQLIEHMTATTTKEYAR